MTEGRILSGAAGGTLHIRLEGDLRFPLASRFENFDRVTFAGESFRAIAVDLTAAEHLDSTMLGLLARLAGHARGDSDSRPVLFSTQEDVNLLLDTMGFEAVFDIRHEGVESVPPLAEIPELDSDPQLPRNVLNAHKALMSMNARNRGVFGATVDMLKREMQSLEDTSCD